MKVSLKFAAAVILFALMIAVLCYIFGLFSHTATVTLLITSVLSAANIFFFGALLEQLIKEKKNILLAIIFLNLKLLAIGLLVYYVQLQEGRDFLAAIIGILCLIPCGLVISLIDGRKKRVITNS